MSAEGFRGRVVENSACATINLQKLPGDVDTSLSLFSNHIESSRREIKVPVGAARALVSDGDSDGLTSTVDLDLLSAERRVVGVGRVTPLLLVKSGNEVAVSVGLSTSSEARGVVGSLTRVGLSGSAAAGRSRRGLGHSLHGSRLVVVGQNGGVGRRSGRGNYSLVNSGGRRLGSSNHSVSTGGRGRGLRHLGGNREVSGHKLVSSANGLTVLVHIDMSLLINVLGDVNVVGDNGTLLNGSGSSNRGGHKGGSNGRGELHCCVCVDLKESEVGGSWINQKNER